RGRWRDAKEQEVQVMETRVLGEEHPDTLTSMHEYLDALASMANLECMFKCQSYNSEAIALIEECLQLRKQVLGCQHPYTAFSL
ncbi:uncharacterized protein BDR25DRAFT_158960, partial [Lindgomyces ingoldianus]